MKKKILSHEKRNALLKLIVSLLFYETMKTIYVKYVQCKMKNMEKKKKRNALMNLLVTLYMKYEKYDKMIWIQRKQ